MKKVKFVALLLLISAVQIFSETITVGVGLALPPYIISEKSNGIELDIVKEALKRAGHNIEIKYLPFARVNVALEDQKVDAALTILESSGVKGVYYTDSHISYQNVAVTLTKNGLTIDKISDLENLNVIGFQNAKLYLGNKFKESMDKNKKYREMAKQESQVAMLFKERTQVNVVDINIFKYYKQLTKITDTSAKVTYHEIFPKTDYKVAFHNKSIRDQFNKSLAEMKKDGTLEKIFKKYIM